jgi:hypothetical protein
MENLVNIKFNEACTIECCIGFDEDEEPIMEEEEILEGEVFQSVFLEQANSEDLWGIEFGNGSYSFVNKSLIEIIKK